MRILVLYLSETGNTAKIAGAICDGLPAKGHEVDRLAMADAAQQGGITADTLGAYDLVFLGAACHDADLARPVKQILAGIPSSPGFKLAGFATHAAALPDGDDSSQQGYEIWASRCALSFHQASQEKGVELLGYFSCQGAPSAPIEGFIHANILPDEDEWEAYIQEARKHPDEEDLRQARAFAREVLSKC